MHQLASYFVQSYSRSYSVVLQSSMLQDLFHREMLSPCEIIRNFVLQCFAAIFRVGYSDMLFCFVAQRHFHVAFGYSNVLFYNVEQRNLLFHLGISYIMLHNALQLHS